MLDVLIPSEEGAFADWLDKAEPHMIASALNKGTSEARLFAFRCLPPDKAQRVLGL